MEAPAIISKTSMKNLTIIGLTPFEKPDVNLMPKLYQAGAYPFLSLGNQLTSAQESLDELMNMNNQESMVYWLEFKNDEEFKTSVLGGIQGGSAGKYTIQKTR